MGEIRYGLYLTDLTHRETNSHGIVNYALGLTAALPERLAANENLILFTNAEVARAVPEKILSERVRAVEQALPAGAWRRLRSDHVGSLRAAAAAGVDVLHYPKGFVPLVNPTGIRTVATVHDDIPLQYAAGMWGRPDRRMSTRYFAWGIKHAVRHADGVVTVSEFSRRQLSLLNPRVEQISVTGGAVSLPATPFVPRSERSPHLLLFGSRLPHKGTAEGVRLVVHWMEGNAESGLHLRVIGDLTACEEFMNDHRIEVVPGGLQNEQVSREIARARALVFPSRYEGFGLPPLEALCLGTPPVFARIPACQEVLGAAPGGYEPGDRMSFMAALDAALSQDDFELRTRAAAAAGRHSWPVVAERTLEAYRQAARSGANALPH